MQVGAAEFPLPHLAVLPVGEAAVDLLVASAAHHRDVLTVTRLAGRSC